jgi:predicted nuclease with TOPRIM domain
MLLNENVLKLIEMGYDFKISLDEHDREIETVQTDLVKLTDSANRVQTDLAKLTDSGSRVQTDLVKLTDTVNHMKSKSASFADKLEAINAALHALNYFNSTTGTAPTTSSTLKQQQTNKAVDRVNGMNVVTSSDSQSPAIMVESPSIIQPHQVSEEDSNLTDMMAVDGGEQHQLQQPHQQQKLKAPSVDNDVDNQTKASREASITQQPLDESQETFNNK